VLTYYRDAAAPGQIQIRLHYCTLFASLSRYDVSIVNPHIWGEPATANLAANDEASAAAWFTVDDLARLASTPPSDGSSGWIN
jgi:hypothetical protein